MSDPTLSDIDFKNKMAWVWTTLKKYYSGVRIVVHVTIALWISTIIAHGWEIVLGDEITDFSIGISCV